MTQPAALVDTAGAAPPNPASSPKSPTPKLVVAVVLWAAGFGAVVAAVIVAYVTGRHIAAWIFPAVYLVGGVASVNLAARFIQRKMFQAVMTLRDAITKQQLAALLEQLTQRQQQQPDAAR